MLSWFWDTFNAYPFRVIVTLGISGIVLFGIATEKTGRVGTAAITGVWMVLYAPIMTYILMTRGAKIFFSPPSIALLGMLLMVTMVALAAFFKVFGLQYAGTPTRVRSFRDCLYFVIITWTTVGYGDIVPSGPWARLGAAYAAILGYFTMSALLAAVSVAMLQP